MADLSASVFSEVDANNNSTPPDGWPSVTMLPNQVEPTARAGMGAYKRAWNRLNATVTTAGSLGSYTYATVNTSYPVSYVQGETFRAKLDKNSIGNDTFQINILSAIPVYKATASGMVKIAAGDLAAGDMVDFVFDQSLNGGGGGMVVRPSGASFVPRGYISGLALSNNSGSPNTKVNVASGQAVDSTNSVVMSFVNGSITALTLGAGTGYTNGTYALSVTGAGSGSGFAGTVTVSGGALTSYSITNVGSDYPTTATISIPAGAGAGTGG